MEIDMKRNLGLLCVLLLLALATGCAGCNVSGTEEKVPEKQDSIAIMTWNVQALFDGDEEGTEYDDYRESADWNREKYRGRLNVIAKAIDGMERKPDVIALQEVESATVVADLAAALSGRYGWTHFAVIPEMALGVGLLSRFPLSETKSHAVNIEGEIAPRPMLEARVNVTAGDGTPSPLELFVCHWKSKLGGDDATESTRRASARIIIRRIRELAQTEPELPVIIMGDLNENYDEFYRRSGAAISALLPDDPRAAEFSGLYGLGSGDVDAVQELQKDFIILSKGKPPVVRYFPEGVTALYSPWAAELQDGSYYYKSDWETIDHFLLSPQLFDETGWEFENCAVVNYPPFVSTTKGLPVAYNPRTGSGLSDHLPLLLSLKMRKP
jgi:endonuclease/exonuclease/phosphatase family metal-dependent hydrolase